MATPKDSKILIEEMTTYMAEYMSNHDPSHNKAHVFRVVKLAHHILAQELTLHPSTAPKMYDKTIVTLSALLHDIGDHKYISSAEAAANDNDNNDPKQLVYNALKAHGAHTQIAERVQTIVSNVSYSNEIRNPAQVRALIEQPGYHELAIVQDADRLDALGGVGIARTFTYLGTQGEKKKASGLSWELDEPLLHFEEKLERLQGMMKTETGREMAKTRTARLKEFKMWWVDETTGSFAT